MFTFALWFLKWTLKSNSSSVENADVGVAHFVTSSLKDDACFIPFVFLDYDNIETRSTNAICDWS